ncbi:MAG: membrane-bound lytic murein transglycosylase MltF [Pseudomonadota bacterium]
MAVGCLALLLAFSGSGCREPDSLAAIQNAGTLVVLSSNSSHGYYQYQDQPRGFEYDLAQAFAQHLGVRLQVLTPPLEKRLAFLEQGRAHLIAAGLHVTKAGRHFLNYSVPYRLVQQEVVVHRYERNVRGMEDLEGRSIHVRKGSFFEYLLRQQAPETPPFTLVAHPEGNQELFLEDVSNREIEATVADEQLVLLARRHFPDLMPAFSLDEPRPLAWAVKKGDQRLLAEINRFLIQVKRDGTVERLWNKYYRDLDEFDYLDLKRFHRRLKTRLPRYREAIVEAAAKNGFDWRLIAAISYQESHFDPLAESYTGVRGLMQLTEVTALEMGVENRLDPHENIRAGVAYLRKLHDRFPEIKEPDRLFFALAAYNVGYGHVTDARRLALEKGLDPNQWSSMCVTLPLLQVRKHYQDTEFGYCRGSEPIRYVNRVLTYYEILVRKAVILQRA